MPKARSWSIALAGIIALAAGNAAAQTVRDSVKEHVDKELDKPGKGKRSGSDRRQRRRGDRSGNESFADDGSGGEQYTVSLADDPALSSDGPRLPHRILPGGLALDFKVDGAYRGWLPQQYDSAEVDVAGYATWSVAVKGKPFRWLTIHRGYYESNGLAAPRNDDAAVAASVGKHIPKAAWALAYLGVPLLKTWQPIVRYETRAFNTTATPRTPVCIVDRSDSGDLMNCPRTMDQLEMISAFETLVFGIRYKPGFDHRSFLATSKGKLFPMYAGLGLMSYHKPYQVTVDGNTLEDFLFDGRFRGAGLALGTNLGGGARRFFADVDMQIGLGEVSLTDDFTLNEVTPDDWLIGYIQGQLHAGYRFVVIEGPPTIYFRPSLSGGGASFHFVRTRAEEGETTGAPNLNWDFLWSARAALELAL